MLRQHQQEGERVFASLLQRSLSISLRPVCKSNTKCKRCHDRQTQQPSECCLDQTTAANNPTPPLVPGGRPVTLQVHIRSFSICSALIVRRGRLRAETGRSPTFRLICLLFLSSFSPPRFVQLEIIFAYICDA